MEITRYPAFIINHDKYRENMRRLVRRCRARGIQIAGVIKGAGGRSGIAEDLVSAGASMIGSSRLEQLARARADGITVPLLMIRVPMLSEIPDLVRIADISLNSEITVLEALNEEALRQNRVHRVILMADLGDLREGWWFDHDELVEAALRVENEWDGLHLEGIGTNLGCYGSVMPTKDKMDYLAALAVRVEEAIGRPLEIVSGGATSSMMAVYDGYMPEKINMLRIGAVAMTGPLEDIRLSYGYEQVDELNDDVFTLQAEVIEVKTKASHPVGKLGVDAFGERPEYVDRGMRKRVLVALGRADFGDLADLIPVIPGMEVIGASGDHTILDVEEVDRDFKPGDIIPFKLRYTAILRLAASENVRVYEIPAE